MGLLLSRVQGLSTKNEGVTCVDKFQDIKNKLEMSLFNVD